MSSIATRTTNVTTLPTTQAPDLQRSHRRQHQAPHRAVEAGHSEGLTAYLTAMGRFHNYSFGNILEIARQKPDATRVAGLYAWNQLGRKVMKGQKGIRILAPMIGSRKKKDTEAEAAKTPQQSTQPVLVGFRAVYVFDVSPDRRRRASRIHRAHHRRGRRVPRTADRLHHRPGHRA